MHNHDGYTVVRASPSEQMRIVGALAIVMICCAMSAQSRPAKLRPDLCAKNSPLSHFTKEDFCAALADLGEASEFRAGPGGTAYRLVVLPSFKHPFSVTIQQRQDGSGEITVRRRNERGELLKLNIQQSSRELDEIASEVNASHFWVLPTIADTAMNSEDQAEARKMGTVVVCGDGTAWIMEGSRNGDYHVSYSGCAPYNQFDALATTISELAKRNFPQAQIDWDR